MDMRYAVVAAFCAMLTGTHGVAAQTCETHERSVGSFGIGGSNASRRASERVVTRSRTGDKDEVVTELYVRSSEGERLALWRRVRRVTRATSDGSEIVEEVEEPNRAAPSAPPRIIERSVTTVRETGTGSFFADQQVFQRDVNGRLVLVCTGTERNSGN